MTTRTVERSDEWEAVPFSGGYAGLHELADQEFSGKIIAGPARLFMLRGSVVGVLGGSIEDFEETEGTAREAPHPALPLLAVMQERSEEVRAKYYSEDTPLSEVNRTLEDGAFTGYVELSENVLSGDYYQVYHQGRSMSVAWVGAAERLISDEEAFQQADDEVGIYSVHPADIEVVEIPEPAGGTAGGGSGAGAGTGTVDAAANEETTATDDAVAADAEASHADATDTDESPADVTDADEDTGSTAAPGDEGGGDASAGTEPSPESTGAEGGGGSVTSTVSDEGETAAASSGTGSTEASGTAGGRPEASEPSSRSTDASTAGDRADATPQSTQGSDQQPARRPADGADDARQPHEQASGGRTTADHQRTGQGTGRDATAEGHGRSPPGRGAGAGGEVAAGDLETRSLPSLDPSRTASAQRTGSGRGGGAAGGHRPSDAGEQHPGAPSEGSGPAGGRADAEPERAQVGGDEPAQRDAGATQPAQQDPGSTPPAQPTEQAGGDAAGARDPSPARDDTAASQPDAAPPESASPERAEADAPAGGRSDPQEAVAEQVEEVEQLQSELGNLEGERDEIAEERDRMERELEEATEELERLRGRLDEAVGEAADAEVRLSPSQAIDETNLFVRYDSRGDATMENAHAGDADRGDVDENLRLEYHTSFDAENAAVDGRPFDDFLTETIQYRFVDWLVRDLLYEVRDTGHGSSMADLYDALPRIDRVELNGIVTVTYTQNGEEHRSQEGFDIVVRDRMGNPLIVANINDSREPATDGMMTELVTAGERVGESNDTLAGVFLVTKSFFEPESLETAEQATSGGLLSRDKRKSFVNLSRKGGYHLCLVEARNQEFHLTVPEL